MSSGREVEDVRVRERELVFGVGEGDFEGTWGVERGGMRVCPVDDEVEEACLGVGPSMVEGSPCSVGARVQHHMAGTGEGQCCLDMIIVYSRNIEDNMAGLEEDRRWAVEEVGPGVEEDPSVGWACHSDSVDQAVCCLRRHLRWFHSDD